MLGRTTWRCVLTSFSLVLFIVLSDTASAQIGQFNLSRVANSVANLLTPPRSVQQIFRDAERAIEEERWSDAVVSLGDYLERDATNAIDDQSMQDYFVEVPQRTNVTVRGGCYQRARDLIGKLPAKALELYKLRYGPNANRLLEQATAAQDIHMMADVRRKYFHTEAGVAASIVLAYRQWQSGHPLACSLLLEDVVELAPQFQAVDESTKLLYVVACHLANRPLPESISVNGPLTNPQGEELLAAGTVLQGSELTEWIDQHFQMLDIPLGRKSSNYPWLGGRSDRNGGASGQLPLSRPEWMVETTSSPRQSEILNDKAAEFASKGITVTPTSQPLRVGDQVLVRTTKWLIGVDYQTGKKVWTFPWFSDADDLDNSIQGETAINEAIEEISLIERVWNDLPYGQMSSDGENLYLLDGLDSREQFRMGGTRRGFRDRAQVSNTLVALELKTEGKLKWRIGADEQDASSLSDAFFLGPPLPVEGRLYVLAEVAGDLGLFCLDPTTGDEIWRQILGASDGQIIRSDPTRRSAGAMLTYHEGLLICPTGSGLVVAVDIHDRSFRWARAFASRRDQGRTSMFQAHRQDTARMLKRWTHGAAIASGNRIVVTPRESDTLFVLDASSGDPMFPPKLRSNSMYVAGIREGQYFVVNAKNVEAFSVDTGIPTWPERAPWLDPSQNICGLSVFGENDLIVPTNSKELIRLSLKDGSIMERKQVDYPLGNLVAADGALFVQTPTMLTLAAGMTSLRPLIADELLRNPDDVDTLADHAKLLLDDGESLEAITVLRRAESLAPDNDEINGLLIDAMLGELRTAEKLDPEMVQALRERIDRPEEQIEFVRLQIQAAFRGSDLSDAPDRLIELSRLVLDHDHSLGGPTLQKSGDTEATLDDWIAARVNDLMDRASESSREMMESKTLDYLTSQIGRPTDQLQQLVTQFQPTASCDQLRTELAKRYLATEKYVSLERLALGLNAAADRNQLNSSRLAMLGHAFAKSGMPEDANSVLLELARRGNLDLVNEIPDPLGVATPSLDGWPNEIEVQFNFPPSSVPGQLFGNRNSAPLVSKAFPKRIDGSDHFEGWDIVISSSSPLSIRNSVGRSTRPAQLSTRASKGTGMRHLTLSGSLAALEIGNELVLVDFSKLHQGLSAEIMWQRDLSVGDDSIQTIAVPNHAFKDRVVRNRLTSRMLANGDLPEITVGPILGDRVILLQSGTLMCLDVRSGDLRWRNTNAPQSGVITVEDGNVYVTSDAEGSITAYDLLDGTKRSTRAWVHGTIWGAHGPHMLAFRRSDDPAAGTYAFDVKLIRSSTQDVILQSQSVGAVQDEDGSFCRGDLAQDRWMTLLRNDGRILIWDIKEGREVVATQIDASQALTGIETLVQEDQLILFRQVPIDRSADENGVTTSTDTSNGQKTFDGIYAFDRASGELRWKQVFEEPWGCNSDHPYSSPLLVCARMKSKVELSKTEKKLDILAIDTRTGEKMAEILGKPVAPTFNITGTKTTLKVPEQVRVEIGSLSLSFQYQFRKQADEPSDPQPVEVVEE